MSSHFKLGYDPAQMVTSQQESQDTIALKWQAIPTHSSKTAKAQNFTINDRNSVQPMQSSAHADYQKNPLNQNHLALTKQRIQSLRKSSVPFSKVTMPFQTTNQEFQSKSLNTSASQEKINKVDSSINIRLGTDHANYVTSSQSLSPPKNTAQLNYDHLLQQAQQQRQHNFIIGFEQPYQDKVLGMTTQRYQVIKLRNQNEHQVQIGHGDNRDFTTSAKLPLHQLIAVRPTEQPNQPTLVPGGQFTTEGTSSQAFKDHGPVKSQQERLVEIQKFKSNLTKQNFALSHSFSKAEPKQHPQQLLQPIQQSFVKNNMQLSSIEIGNGGQLDYTSEAATSYIKKQLSSNKYDLKAHLTKDHTHQNLSSYQRKESMQTVSQRYMVAKDYDWRTQHDQTQKFQREMRVNHISLGMIPQERRTKSQFCVNPKTLVQSGSEHTLKLSGGNLALRGKRDYKTINMQQFTGIQPVANLTAL